ncbi:MAG: WhiB family transcriptional regulator, partial [Actinomycetes bacterium]
LRRARLARPDLPPRPPHRTRCRMTHLATEPARVRRCTGRSDLFDEPTPGDTTAEWSAKRLCYSCPQLYACREWAVRTDVAGICGGLTEAERVQWRAQRGIVLGSPDRFVATDVLGREARSGRHVDPELVAQVQHLLQRMTAQEVATRIGVTPRTVERYRARRRATDQDLAS